MAIGETVRLRSGGPIMTILAHGGNKYEGWTSTCMWFDADGKHVICVPMDATWLWTAEDEARERKRGLKDAQPRKPRRKRITMLGHDRVSA